MSAVVLFFTSFLHSIISVSLSFSLKDRGFPTSQSCYGNTAERPRGREEEDKAQRMEGKGQTGMQADRQRERL